MSKSAVKPEYEDMARRSAHSAIDIAFQGEAYVDELRSILRAIVELSRDHEVIHGLAKVGFDLAEDRHNLLNAEHEDMVQKLLILNGGNHV
ncbi:MAG: hypothetical protein V4805_17620 [Pseudomonadota bacterium]